jgi:hypothetical protein
MKKLVAVFGLCLCFLCGCGGEEPKAILPTKKWDLPGSEGDESKDSKGKPKAEAVKEPN